MNRKLLLLSIGLILILVAVLVATAAGDRLKALTAKIQLGEIHQDADRAACTMNKSNLAAGSIGYWSGFSTGDVIATYFDPTDPVAGGCGVAAAYPFELTAFSFPLFTNDDPELSFQWPVTVDVVVYDVTSVVDPCVGPATELCRFTVVCDQATFDNAVGTVAFPQPCCVDRQFYIGIEYQNDPIAGNNWPSVIFDDNAAPAVCDNWFYYSGYGYWSEWYDIWSPPTPGYPMYVVDGETVSENCDDPWAHHKMHFPQLPDEDGWDVYGSNPIILADDWECSETGDVMDIHWWGSWLDDAWAPIDYFELVIYEDLPADPSQGIPYSRPGDELWSYDVAEGDYIETIIDLTGSDLWEGWYDPTQDPELVIYPDHQRYFRYDVFIPASYAFPQEEGTIYWLGITAHVNADYQGHFWGWKSTENHFWDDAVYWNGIEWIDLVDPVEVEELSNFFEIQLDPQGMYIGGMGVGAYVDPADPSTNGWYLYEEDFWWNIWFYDHPLDYDRVKDVRMEFFVSAIGEPFWAAVTPNWSTDIWTVEGPAMEPRPPMPWDFVGGDPPEGLWIGRGDPLYFEIPESDAYYWMRVYNYNPEWVSVDVQGANAWVEGTIYHTCRASLDLAFVITGEDEPEPDGACCYDPTGGPNDAVCIVTTQTNCEQVLGGVYQGDGSTCQGEEACCLDNNTCVMADALCCVNELGGVPQGPGSDCQGMEACCLDDGLGSCVMADALCCVNELGGTPQGAGSVCTQPEACCMPNNTCQMIDPLCCDDMGGVPQGPQSTCQGMEACCLQNGDCVMADALCCVNELGGTPQGPGTVCTAPQACCFDDGSCQDLDPLCCADMGGDPMGVGTDCVTTVCDVAPYTPKNWYQAPDLSEIGMDVNATYPMCVLADDFLCTETGGIQEIHIWGSWLHDIYPGSDPPLVEGDPGNVTFHLSIHADIPPFTPPFDLPWSIPGPMLRDWYFEPTQFIYKPVKLLDDYEGWFNPPFEWEPMGDANCWEYIFQFDETNWFEQYGNAGEPVIYWLDVQAMVPPSGMPAFFGWKTTTDHWNDDAVWIEGEDIPQQLYWNEMRYPDMHPYFPESIDQAFLIGGPCDCEPGEADGKPLVNILDIVYLINYKYKLGPNPLPYELCSGDTNCDCLMNILDIVYLINYKYKDGPHPCTCGNFIANCGGPLR